MCEVQETSNVDRSKGVLHVVVVVVVVIVVVVCERQPQQCYTLYVVDGNSCGGT